jgi:hypothetical protein
MNTPSQTSLFTMEFLTKNNKTVVYHFDKTVIEAESQAVLNILTEHSIQDAYKMAEALGTVHTRGRGLLRSFDQMAASVPEYRIINGYS